MPKISPKSGFFRFWAKKWPFLKSFAVSYTCDNASDLKFHYELLIAEKLRVAWHIHFGHFLMLVRPLSVRVDNSPKSAQNGDFCDLVPKNGRFGKVLRCHIRVTTPAI